MAQQNNNDSSVREGKFNKCSFALQENHKNITYKDINLKDPAKQTSKIDLEKQILLLEKDVESYQAKDDKNNDILKQKKDSLQILQQQYNAQFKIPIYNVNKSAFARNTSKDKEVKILNDYDFLDYSSFLLKQPNICSTEKLKNDIDSTRNIAKERKTFQSILGNVRMVMMTMLAVGIIVLFVAAIVYSFVFKNDPIKRKMDFVILYIVVIVMAAFIIFITVFMKMSSCIKKIMSLM